MEKIDIDVLWKGNGQFDVQKIVLVAEKLNELIDKLKSEVHPNL